MTPPPPTSTLFPYTTLFRSTAELGHNIGGPQHCQVQAGKRNHWPLNFSGRDNREVSHPSHRPSRTSVPLKSPILCLLIIAPTDEYPRHATYTHHENGSVLRYFL